MSNPSPEVDIAPAAVAIQQNSRAAAIQRTAAILLVGAACTHSAPARSASGRPEPVTCTPVPAAWVQRFADHDGVRIEYRIREAPGLGLPVVLIPGMTGDARTYEGDAALIAALGPRKLVAISLRGRGASDSPETGWTPEDHHRDVHAVIEAEKLGRYHLVGHSMGVAYGIGFALGRPPGEIASLTAADYFPAVIQVTEEWAKAVESRPPPLSYDPRIGRRVLREQGTRDYTDRLGELHMPILVVLGTRSAEPRVEGLYAKAPDHRVIWIDHGHDTFSNRAALAALAEHVATAEHR